MEPDQDSPPGTAIDFACELNPQQLAAVTAPDGPSLVLAGAGSGKTRTLTYRVAWLLQEHGIRPEQILLLTFTNKAAREMMDRVAQLLGGHLPPVWGGTFHSIGLRILRQFSDRIGYRPDFAIADRDDIKELLAACIAEAGIDTRQARFPKPDVLAEIYSMQANTGRTLDHVVAHEHPGFAAITHEIAALHPVFTDRKRQAGVMDFDDLLLLWRRLLEQDNDVREYFQRRFHWVLVDEYQDTNHLQSAIIDLMSGLHRNITVVGDDAQSIYSWRGADFSHILGFPDRHPEAQVFRIETNYRSSPEILAVANAAIAANQRQFKKKLRAAQPTGPKPARITCTNGSEQAAFIVQRTRQIREAGIPLSRVCVLYRSHFHALEIQMELTRAGIPFLITSGIRFFEQAHIKDIAAHLRFVTQPADELSFKRLARMLPGIGAKGSDKLWTLFSAIIGPRLAELPPSPSIGFSDNDGALAAPPDEPRPPDLLPAALAALTRSIPQRAAAAWASLAATLVQIARPDWRDLPGRCIRHLLEHGYKDHLEANYENPRNRMEDLTQLAAYADQFSSTTELLSQLALQSQLEADAAANTAGVDDGDRLRLSTVHQAKGLEFHTVFVIMLCEGMFPTHRSLEDPDAMEEERRLFYVAVTRAERELYLTRPLLRVVQGFESVQPSSRFLGEIPSNLLEEWNLNYGRGRTPSRSTPPPSRTPTVPAASPDSDHPDYEAGEPEPF